MFSETFLTELAERNDIVEVVSEYVSLGKRSGANYFGLCPFHNEKTPSFSVSPEKQIYYCFGCGKGGGVINFMMEIEQLSYPEAVERLAKRAGIPVPEQENDVQSRRRARLYEVNKAAARYFHEQLNAPGGAGARDYISKRQISRKMATSFGLGYAPDSYNIFEQEMVARGFTSSELASADLIRPGSKGGTYATFRNRLMFPVIDVRGNVTGFSGRIIGDGEPKYLNTRETPVFSKGRLLFGLNLARKSKRDYIILVEGNVDVVSLHQAGFDSAVASLGTSLTKEQAQLISRYKKEVVLAYDNDGAGLKASQRAIDILEKLDDMLRIVDYIEGYLPDLISEYRSKLENKVKEFLDNSQIEDARIAAEVTIFADKTAIDEELVRLRTHIINMKDILMKGGEVGRNLDFIAQEMNRESNTILSKSSNINITNSGIELKTCIEKIREQVQNIE